MLDWGKKDEFVQAMFRRSHSVHSRRFYEVALRKLTVWPWRPIRMIVRPNKRQITKEIYLEKVKRWTKLWSRLKVIPWD